jgi:hypothetical protein
VQVMLAPCKTRRVTHFTWRNKTSDSLYPVADSSKSRQTKFPYRLYKIIFTNTLFTCPELKDEFVGGASTASHTLNLDESRFAVPHFAV